MLELSEKIFLSEKTVFSSSLCYNIREQKSTVIFILFKNGVVIMDAEKKKAAADARNAYARKWRAENKDKVRANNERYWMRRAEKEAAAQKDRGGK